MLNITLNTRLFITVRKIIFPPKYIEKMVPEEAKIIDIGCGHGVLAYFLASKGRKRSVTGLDPSAQKISVAKKYFPKLKNLNYRKGFAKNIRGRYDVVIIMDVLYLLPAGEKKNILKIIKKLISKKGFLILKETEPNSFLRFEEYLATKLFKFTYTSHNKTYLSGSSETKKLLKESGFKIVSTKRIRRLAVYNHYIFKAAV